MPLPCPAKENAARYNILLFMFKQISYVYTMISFAWSLWILLLLNHNTYIWYVQYFTSVIQRAFWKYYTLNCFPGIFQQFPTIYEGMLFAPFPHLLVWFITAALISAFCSTLLWYFVHYSRILYLSFFLHRQIFETRKSRQNRFRINSS